MKLSAYCMYCLIKRQEENIRTCQNEEIKANYMREVLRIIANTNENITAPVIVSEINKLHQKFFETTYSFNDLKLEYNRLMIEKESNIVERINLCDDRLLAALKFARAGNYIDFGAMGQVDNEKLMSLLEKADKEMVDIAEYESFRNDLKKAKRLIYLTDNCGEIVLDKIFIKTIKEEYPNINITVIVRGKPVLNDATIEDAEMVELTEVATVIGNGTEIAGTQLDAINVAARQAIESADVVISKGQGNFETLNGCGLNIYYLFLCKCDWFVNRFKLEMYKGVFVNEKNIVI